MPTSIFFKNSKTEKSTEFATFIAKFPELVGLPLAPYSPNEPTDKTPFLNDHPTIADVVITTVLPREKLITIAENLPLNCSVQFPPDTPLEDLRAAAAHLRFYRTLCLHPDTPPEAGKRAAAALKPLSKLWLPHSILPDNAVQIVSRLKEKRYLLLDSETPLPTIKKVIPKLQPRCYVKLPADSKKSFATTLSAALPHSCFLIVHFDTPASIRNAAIQRLSIGSGFFLAQPTYQGISHELVALIKPGRGFMLYPNIDINNAEKAAAALPPQVSFFLHPETQRDVGIAIAKALAVDRTLFIDFRMAKKRKYFSRAISIVKALNPGCTLCLDAGIPANVMAKIVKHLPQGCKLLFDPPLTGPIESVTTALPAGCQLLLDSEITSDIEDSVAAAITKLQKGTQVSFVSNIAISAATKVAAALPDGCQLILKPEPWGLVAKIAPYFKGKDAQLVLDFTDESPNAISPSSRLPAQIYPINPATIEITDADNPDNKETLSTAPQETQSEKLPYSTKANPNFPKPINTRKRHRENKDEQGSSSTWLPTQLQKRPRVIHTPISSAPTFFPPEPKPAHPLINQPMNTIKPWLARACEIVRGKTWTHLSCTDNCTLLASKLLVSILLGQLPDGPAEARRSTLADFAAVQSDAYLIINKDGSAVIKPEPPAANNPDVLSFHSTVVSSDMQTTAKKHPVLKACRSYNQHTIFVDNDSDSMDTRTLIDTTTDSFQQLKVSNKTLKDSLIELAKNSRYKLAVGFINLARFDAHRDDPGHQIVYCATYDEKEGSGEVVFIECQNITPNNANKGGWPALIDNLDRYDIFDPENPHTPGPNTFDPHIYFAPFHFRGLGLNPVKPEPMDEDTDEDNESQIANFLAGLSQT